MLRSLNAFGLSSICNILAAVKTAKHLRLGPDDVIMTVATDGATMYGSERKRIAARDFPDGFDVADAAEVFGGWMLGTGPGDLLETTLADRNRIFNLGYYTWVEQQGVPLADFEARRDQRFWTGLRDLLPAWDAMITELRERPGRARITSRPARSAALGVAISLTRPTPARSGARGPEPTTPTTC